MVRAFWVAAILSLSGCVFDPPGDCSAAADCMTGARCDQGVCVMGCEQDLHCASWEGCNLTAHRCELSPGRCSLPAHCQQWEACNSNHVCEVIAGACNGSGDCEEWETCTGNACVLTQGRCNTGPDCGSLFGVCGSNHQCSAVLPSNGDILMFGGLRVYGGDPCMAAISPLLDPLNVQVGFARCPGVYTDAALRDDGSLVYTSEEADGSYTLRQFKPDNFYRDEGGWHYPQSPEANDPLISTPGCNPDGWPTEIYAQPGTGKVIYQCLHSISGPYFDIEGELVLDKFTLDAWNASGDFFGRPESSTKYSIRKTDGTVIPTELDLFGPYYVATAKSHGMGFRMALRHKDTAEHSLWDVYADGTIGRVRTYGTIPTPIHGDFIEGYYLDSQGALYSPRQVVRDSGETTMIIVKMPVDGSTPTEIYDALAIPAGYNERHHSTLKLFNRLRTLVQSP